MTFNNPNQNWISIDLDNDWEDEAKKIRKERDAQYGNIFEVKDTDMRWVGDLGEMVFNDWLKRNAAIVATWHLDDPAGKADFTLAGGATVGVKTVKRKVPPRSGYEAQVTEAHAKEPVDFFFFLSYEFLEKRMWLLGGIEKSRFLANARYIGPGEFVHANYQVRPGHAIYNMDIGLLTSPDLWAQARKPATTGSSSGARWDF